MKIILASFCLLFIINTSFAAPAPNSFSDLAERLLPSVVNISTTQKQETLNQSQDIPQFPEGSPFQDFFDEFFDRRLEQFPSQPAISLGSGFVVDVKQGYVVTNNHVIANADSIKLTLHNDQTIDAEVIGRDKKTDLAVLKFDAKASDLSGIQPLNLGDSGQMRVGDWVLAIGNPFGLGGTVTAGIISARQRNIQAGPYDDFIQTDASINRGNSGGPMFNIKGEVIGINTAIYSPSGGSVGIGFAIPSNQAKPVIDQLIKYGKTRRGWLGVRIQYVTEDIAESLGLERARGALVASVNAKGPAAKAGLQAGDVILSFNNEPIEEMRELPRIVAATEIGSTVSLSYLRDSKVRKTRVSVGELEVAEENGLLESDVSKAPQFEDRKIKTTELSKLGFSTARLGDDLRARYGLEETIQGVVILDVTQGSQAAREGLGEGDVILKFEGEVVSAPKDIQRALKKVQGKKKAVLMLVYSAGSERFIALPIGE